uniref:Uncharacterized protein n=1 Tax=viral metagenome TaxID=1070528 RepID=A0A6M3JP96_9ZZZZ
MRKYFHKLAEEEFKELVKEGMTWGECAEEYPQPKWCNYPDAVQGALGCWSLMDFRIKGRSSCKCCIQYIPATPTHKGERSVD